RAHHRSEAPNPGVDLAALDLGRGDEQRAEHRAVGCRPLVFVPPGDRVAAEAVRDQDHGPPGALDRQVEPIDPGIAVRVVPRAEIDAGTIVELALPVTLPVVRAAPGEAGDQQHEGFGSAGRGSMSEIGRPSHSYSPSPEEYEPALSRGPVLQPASRCRQHNLNQSSWELQSTRA